MGAWAYRAVSDVSLNADPTTGQYVVVIAPGSSASWVSAGGTSLATPQWAGILAVADAERARDSLAPLGEPHAQLYHLAAQATVYASDFYDITHGSDGSCAVCYAQNGYDAPSGLGTPNVTQLLSDLTEAPPPTAPVVTAASVTGTTGVALSFTPAVSAGDTVTYALTGAPAGMAIAANGLVSWASPVTGTYAVTVTATDSVTRLAGHAVYTVTITAPKPPVVTGGALTGTAGAALTYTVTVTAADAVTFSLVDAPNGMTISTAGVLGWPTPQTGSYAVTVTARDTKTGLTGSAVLEVNIAAPKPPVLSPMSVSGTAGHALSFAVAVTAADPVSFGLAGAPAGMVIGDRHGDLGESGRRPVHGHPHRHRFADRPCRHGSCDRDDRAGGAGDHRGIADRGCEQAPDRLDRSVRQHVRQPQPQHLRHSGRNDVHAERPDAGRAMGQPVTGNYTLNVSVTDGNGAHAALAVPVTITAK